MEDEEHVADHFVDDLLTSSFGCGDAQLAYFLAEAIPPSIAWLREHGVRFTSRETQFLSQSRPRLLPDGGGLAIVEAPVARQATRRGELGKLVDRGHGYRMLSAASCSARLLHGGHAWPLDPTPQGTPIRTIW